MPKPTEQLCSNSIFRALLQLSPAHHFHFRPTLNIKDSSYKKQETERQAWNFTKYVIKLAGEIAKKVLLSVI